MASPASARPTTSEYCAPAERAAGSQRAPAEASRPARDSWLASLPLIAGATMVLLLPAFFNGYPILFSDTADYLLRSQSLVPSPIRAPGYAVWIRLTSGGLSLWLPVVAQALFLAALIVRTVRVFGRLSLRYALGAVLALTIFTSAGWVASKAMPDLFVAMVVLGLWLAVAHWPRLGIADRALAIASIVIGGTMHLTNILVGASVLAALFALAMRDRRPTTPRRDWYRAALLLVASAAITRGFEYLRRDEAEKGWNGSMFVLSHLVETGLAERLLHDRCDVEQYALCAVRDTLTRPVDLFVWRPLESPRYLVLHDDPALIRAETNHILGGIVRHYPLALVGSIASYTGRQLVAFRVNDEIWRHRHRTEVQRVIMAMYPRDLPAQERARQQENTLRLAWTPIVHLTAFLAAAAFSLILLLRAFRNGEIGLANSAGLHVMVWVALVANAAICANLAAVFSRYQSRVSWLLPLAAIATFVERGMLPQLRLTRRTAARA